MSAPEEYRGSITREQWLATETRTVARLRVDEGIADAAEIIARVVDENLFHYPTERELKSISRACNRRLNALLEQDDAVDPTTAAQTHAALLQLIAHGTQDQLCQTNLYAMARDNRIVWDFLVAVVARKLASFDYALVRREIASFIEGLGAQDEKAATWSDATKNKIRQVLTMCLEKAGMYNRSTEELRPPLLDLELEELIRTNHDQILLPAFGIEN